MRRAREPQIRGTFSRLFGDDPAARILDVLIVNQGHDLSLKDVAEAAGISTKTLWQVLPRLEETEIIKHTRQVGNAKMITLEKNPITKQLYNIATEIALRLMDKAGQAEKEAIPVTATAQLAKEPELVRV